MSKNFIEFSGFICKPPASRIIGNDNIILFTLDDTGECRVTCRYEIPAIDEAPPLQVGDYLTVTGRLISHNLMEIDIPTIFVTHITQTEVSNG